MSRYMYFFSKLEGTINTIKSETIFTLSPNSFWVFMKLYLCPIFELEGKELGGSLAQLNKMIGVSSRDFKNSLDELEQQYLIRLVYNVSVIKRGRSPQKVILSGEIKEFLVQSYDEKSLADIQKVLAFKNSNGLKLMIKEKALLLYSLLIKDSVAMSEKYIKKTFDVKIKSAHEKFSQYDFKFHGVSKINFDNDSRIFRVEKKDSSVIRMDSVDVNFLVRPNRNQWKQVKTRISILYTFGDINANPSLDKLVPHIKSYFKYYPTCKMVSAESPMMDEVGSLSLIRNIKSNYEFSEHLKKVFIGLDAKTRDLISDEAGLELIINEKYSAAENYQFQNYIFALKKGGYSDAYLDKIAKSVVKLIFKKEHYLSGYYFFRAICDFYVLILERLEKRLLDDFAENGLSTIHINDHQPVFFNVRTIYNRTAAERFLFKKCVFQFKEND